MTARVLLGDVPVGELVPIHDSVLFELDSGYVEMPERPTLGLWYEDHDLSERRVFSDQKGLPNFFRNLLPEGALRKIVDAQLGRGGNDYAALIHLGHDLPGNVRVVLSSEQSGQSGSPARIDRGDGLRFSLAGVQLKASVDVLDQDRVTIPLAGEGGHWIAKLPSPAFRALPENEYAILQWARLSGLNVPDHRLIEVDAIEQLPFDPPERGKALLVRRFDRSDVGRIHQEDFAQVFNVDPLEKYAANLPLEYNHAGIGAIIREKAGYDDFIEYIRRIAFVILSGNADAHLKNWSLLYPDGIRPRLSPVYDLVCTVAYEHIERYLALLVTPPNDTWHTPPVLMTEVGLQHFRVMAELAGEAPDAVEEEVRAFVAKARAAWLQVDGVPDFLRDAIGRHMPTVQL